MLFPIRFEIEEQNELSKMKIRVLNEPKNENKIVGSFEVEWNRDHWLLLWNAHG